MREERPATGEGPAPGTATGAVVEAAPPVEPRTVVCGVDASPGAAEVVAVARRLAAALGLRLVVAHAARAHDIVPRTPPIGASYPPGTVEGLRAEAIEAGERLLDDLLADAWLHDADRAVVAGHPASVLLDAARDGDAALIVVGSRGLGSVARVVKGSVSQEVIAAADCPVVVVPAPRHPGER